MKVRLCTIRIESGMTPASKRRVMIPAARPTPSSSRQAHKRLHGLLQVLRLVFSAALWLRPTSDCTNIITVGIPSRATSAASCSGPEGNR